MIEVKNGFKVENRLKFNNKSELEAFEENFIPEPNSGCWLWTGNLIKRGGYGAFNFGKKIMQRAHRVSWKLYRYDITKDQHVLHSCDNPCCVNPDHLFLGDQSLNMFDMSMKGRQAHAESHPHYKHGKYVGDKQNPTYKHPLN